MMSNEYNSMSKNLAAAGGRFDKEKEYWLQKLSGDLEACGFPADKTKANNTKALINNIEFVFSSELSQKIIKISKGSDKNLYYILSAGVAALLHSYTESRDIIIGAPIYKQENGENLINTILALRCAIDTDAPFKQLLMDIKGVFTEATANQNYPLDILLESMGINKINKLIKAAVLLESLQSYEYISSMDLAVVFSFEKTDEAVSCRLYYDEGLYSRTAAELMLKYLNNILLSAVDSPNTAIADLSLLTEQDKEQLLTAFNNTAAEYPRDKTIQEIFEEQVQKTPDNTAVQYGQDSITYKALNHKANQIAALLREKGVRADSIVGIITERSIEMIIGIIAVLKAGGAYLPIDPDYPIDRIEYMLEDSQADILLTQRGLIGRLSFEKQIIELDNEDLYAGAADNLPIINTQKDLAYIIYTSGTTGKPKGAMIEHRNVVRLMFNDKMKFDFNSTDVWTMFHSYCFDFSVWEMYGALLYGGRLVIVPKTAAVDSREYVKLLKREGVTILNQTPSVFYRLIEEELQYKDTALQIRYVIFGGEALQPLMLKGFYKKYPDTRLINMYGITETTVHVTYKEITMQEIEANISNIGTPIPTLTTYVMDKQMRLLPIGIAGELCVGGDGVCRGYLKRPELTAEKFVMNPYKEERLYKSGDLVKMLPNGEMEYLGRIDNQVKIRGFRIELGEIESKLLNHADIKDVVVIAKQSGDNKYLCAYITAQKELTGQSELTSQELREHLSKELPDYMIPSYFIKLERMPLTQNGKIDRRSLPEPDANAILKAAYEAPRNEIEEKLAELWKEVLGLENVGINDNFFDLGGHSLNASTLVGRLHKELGVKLSVKRVFEAQTIKSMASCIQAEEKNIYNEIQPIALEDKDKAYFEMSSAQKRIYTLQQFDLDSTSYNIPIILVAEGSLDRHKLQDTFQRLIQRHEALRTSFDIAEEEAMQIINRNIEFAIEYYDGISSEDIYGEEIKSKISKFIRAFDLKKAPLCRVGLIALSEKKHILMLDIHHIIADGVSMEILVHEFVKLYEDNTLPELRIQYKDFAVWQNKLFRSDAIKEQEQYWLEVFHDASKGQLPVLNIATDYPRPAIQSFEGSSIEFSLSKEQADKLRLIARETGNENGALTMYMVMLAAFNIMLSKYSGQEDIVIGSPIAGRPHGDLEGIIGMFVNTLAMRNYPKGDKTIREFLQEVKENSLKAYENQDYQFEELVDKLKLPRNMSRNPLFDVMLTMQTINAAEEKLDNLTLKAYKTEKNISKFDLTLMAIEKEAEMKLQIEYCTKLFKEETIVTMKKHLITVIEQMCSNIDARLSEIELITEAERLQILKEYNNTETDYSRDKTIHQLFEEQVQRTPDNIAAECEGKVLTYRQLNEKADSLAKVLAAKGVKADSIVGIMVQRSLEMMIGILGILKAGGAYLPIAPEYPRERIQYMLEDSGADIVLTQADIDVDIAENKTILYIDNEDIYDAEACTNPVQTSKANNLAYVIYTSGSTGKPKGVMLEHRSVVNYLEWVKKQYSHIAALDFAVFTSLSFDLTVTSIFTPLITGHKAIIYRDTDVSTIIKETKAGIIKLTPAHLEIIKEHDISKSTSKSNVRCLIVGGEELKTKLCEDISESFRHNIAIYNEYGPTEAAVGCMIHRYNKDKDTKNTVSIGVPAANTKLYILDKYSKLCPVGIAGELCIAGDGLARGYLNKPELTEQRFTSLLLPSQGASERIYRTGDLARRLPDGTIEFLGRIDHQVKIRGYRIELGEIEGRLTAHNAVKEAVVIAKTDTAGVKYLCAYITAQEQPTVRELREYLSKSLPDYMLPSYFVFVDQMPLTANGKIDKTALADSGRYPETEGGITAETEYEASANKIEEKLAEIWQQILGIDNIGINHNFFELGGHSLKATAMIAKIHKELERTVPLREVFRTPTIKGIAEYINSSEKSIYSEIQPAEAEMQEENILEYQASSAQKRLFALQQLEPKNISYNMPVILELTGELNKEKLKNAIEVLIQRHEALRTSFKLTNDKLLQIVHKQIPFEIECTACIEKNNKEQINQAIKSFIKPFDLSKAPLIRAGLIELISDPEEQKHCSGDMENRKILPEQKHCSGDMENRKILPEQKHCSRDMENRKILPKQHLVLLDIHHIICDGVSTSILTKEFAKAYEGVRLPELRLQYKDYAVWQNLQLKSQRMKEQEQYWLKVYGEDIPVLNMPTDYPRPAIQSYEGSSVDFRLKEDLTERLRQIAKDTGSTLYMVMLAALNVLLAKYSGQEDIVIGSPIAGRPHADLDNIIGMFVNTLALRSRPSANKTFRELLKEVRETAIKAYENQDYQFEELIDKLNIERDMSRNPLFDVMLMFQNMDTQALQLKDMSINTYENKNTTSKLDMTFIAMEAGKEIILSIQYCTKLFKEATIARLYNSFENILGAVSERLDSKIEDISILSENDRQQILNEFNNTIVEYPKEKLIHQLFEEQVQKNPDKTAAVYENKYITYKELNEKANQLARILQQEGAGADSIVGLMIGRSLDMLISIMAVLKAGGAYLPIDPEYPTDRIEYMLKDSQASILLTQASIAHEQLTRCKLEGLKTINADDSSLYAGDSSNLSTVAASSNTAYVIYTSGSTGQPKGVAIRHYSVNNFIRGMTDQISFNPNKRILALTTICFDIFGLETLLPLTQGMEIAIAGEELQKDTQKLVQLIQDKQIDILQATPSRMEMIMESTKEEKALTGLKEIIIGGEAFPKALLDKLTKKTTARIYNVYGPTETTIWSTIKELLSDGEINIGKPIANTQIYIVDKDYKLCPVGVAGELCIAGDGLAKGYLNREELTREKFISNPYAKETKAEWDKMYRTGDLARWLPDGSIEFMGRMDYQVKIRGYRIELGEIESKLLEKQNIKEAAVLVRQNKRSKNKYLCAYLTGEGIDTQQIKASLKKKLPDYMVPSSYIILDKMPQTSNGKINRKALMTIEAPREEKDKIPPRDYVQSTIADIWKEILGLEEVCINDDFFELGGNSINIIQIANKIKDILGAEVNPADLMVYNTIEELSEQINSMDADRGKYKHLFKLNRSKSKTNIFIIHGGDADIFYYRYLAKLLEEEYCVYGLQPSGLKLDEELPKSYYEMYHNYVKEIRMLQPQGPYIIAGYCIGGYISFDIAKILEMQGERVAALLQLDQEAFVIERMHKYIRQRNLIFRAVDLWRRISRKDKMYTLEAFMNMFPKAQPVPKEKHMELLKNKKALQQYLQKQMPGECQYAFIGRSVKAPTLVIKAEENNNPLLTRELWENMAKGPLEYYEVPGGHETVLLPPYVDKFAEILKDYLKRTL